MEADDPRHGSVAGAAAHLTDGEPQCYSCRVAKAKYQTDTDRLRAYGRWNPWADPGPARAHVKALMASGMPIAAIAKAADVNTRRITHLLYGAGERGLPTKIRPDYAERLLAVQTVPSRVQPLGAQRRLRALVALGYPATVLAEHLGFSQARVDQLLRHDRKIMRSTHDRVDAVFQRLSMILPAEGTTLEKYRASRARNTAERNGWAPPLAWTDIDDPAEQPNLGAPDARGGNGGRSIANLLEDAEWLADSDATLTEAVARLDVNRDTFRETCNRAGRSDLYWRLARREPDGEQRWEVSQGIKRRKEVA